MTDRTEAIQGLLVEAQKAHGVYEATELKGVYDENWPQWYASYAVDHGIGVLVGREVETDRLARLLSTGFDEFKQVQADPSEPWSAYLARRVVTEL